MLCRSGRERTVRSLAGSVISGHGRLHQHSLLPHLDVNCSDPPIDESIGPSKQLAASYLSLRGEEQPRRHSRIHANSVSGRLHATSVDCHPNGLGPKQGSAKRKELNYDPDLDGVTAKASCERRLMVAYCLCHGSPHVLSGSAKGRPFTFVNDAPSLQQATCNGRSAGHPPS